MGTRRLSGFKTVEDAERLHELYDTFVAETWPVPREELDIDTRFGSTHVRRSGHDTGTPIVLIHPNTGTSAGWYRLVEPMARHHPIVALDTVGTPGRSVQTAPFAAARDLGVWLDDALDALQLDRVHLLGYSEGGWIAATHAAHTTTPDRLATLTLIEPGGALLRIRPVVLARLVGRGVLIVSGIVDRERGLRALSEYLSPGVELTDREMELVLTSFRTFRQRLPMPVTLSDDQLRSITTPTLLLLAENTVLYDPAAAAERARRLLPEVEIDIVSGAGHGLPFQFPDLVTARVLTFVDAVSDRGHR